MSKMLEELQRLRENLDKKSPPDYHFKGTPNYKKDKPKPVIVDDKSFKSIDNISSELEFLFKNGLSRRINVSYIHDNNSRSLLEHYTVDTFKFNNLKYLIDILNEYSKAFTISPCELVFIVKNNSIFNIEHSHNYVKCFIINR